MNAAAVLSALCLALPLPFSAQSSPPSPAHSATDTRLYYYATPRSTLETEVHSIPETDEARFEHLKALFADKGCSGDQLRVQPLHNRRGGPGTLICTWPGNSADTVVVLAEYQHQGKGQGAVENWSGAVLLPYLYFAMQARQRQNTWIFVEAGSKGSAAEYVHSLSGEQKKQIRAMVALTGLGVSPITRYFSPNPESPYLSAAVVHLQMTLALTALSDLKAPFPQFLSPLRWLSADDTQPFRYSHVPCILLDSISGQDAGLPGSTRDTAAAIDGNAYFMNYRIIAVFLAGLDALAGKLDVDDRFWRGEGGTFHFNPDDLPVLH
jgi:hypothetical protein